MNASVSELASRVSTTRFRGATCTESIDVVALEEPLKLCIGGEVYTVTMRTPGHDHELAAGLLLSERLIRSGADLVRLFHCGRSEREGFGNTLNVTLAPSARVDKDLLDLRRGTMIASACGVCGRRSIDDLLDGLSPLSGATFRRDVLSRLTEALRAEQPGFAKTEGLHAAGIANSEGLYRVVREDIGRHNATDKVIGRLLLDGQLPLHDCVLVVSGRTSFEIVAKALTAGIPAVVGVSAPSSLAVSTAEQAGQLLLGFARNGDYNVYSGAQRLET